MPWPDTRLCLSPFALWYRRISLSDPLSPPWTMLHLKQKSKPHNVLLNQVTKAWLAHAKLGTF